MFSGMIHNFWWGFLSPSYHLDKVMQWGTSMCTCNYWGYVSEWLLLCYYVQEIALGACVSGNMLGITMIYK